MTRTVTATEAKVRLGSIMKWIAEKKEAIIIESRGQPKVVLIPFQEYEEIRALQEEERRRQALARLEALAERVGARNQDLSLKEAEELADRFTREVIEEMIEEGKLSYERS